MEIGHQLRQIAMGGDQIIIHVIGVAGGVAQPLQPVDLGHLPQQAAQGVIPRRPCAVIGIHVLAQKRQLPHPARHEIARLGQDAVHRAADLGPARVGHHAKGAKLVAAFLHRQKRRRPARSLAFGQKVKLHLGGKLGVHGLPPGARHLGQAVIGLRADHQIDHGHPPQDLIALGLRHAARHTNLHARLGLLQRFQPAKVGVKLFAGLFADVAGVQQHHIRILGCLGQHIAIRAHRLSHALAVVDVHLTAVGLDEKFLDVGHGHTCSQALPISQTRRARNACLGRPAPLAATPARTEHLPASRLAPRAFVKLRKTDALQSPQHCLILRNN